MSALGETQARIESARKLGAVVGAMRGIAAIHVGKARAALDGYKTYANVVEAALARAVALLEAPTRAAPSTDETIVIVFAAEHGFAGAFSERVLDAARLPDRHRLFVVGARGLVLAEQRGLQIAWSTNMASQSGAVGPVARRIADSLYETLVEEGLARAEVLHARPAGLSDFTIAQEQLLPVDSRVATAPSAGPPPMVNLPPRKLVELLVSEHVFAKLALAALESFASENAARLAAMEAGRLNIQRKLEDLEGQERSLRQEQITAEVQDVVAGALASSALS